MLDINKLSAARNEARFQERPNAAKSKAAQRWSLSARFAPYGPTADPRFGIRVTLVEPGDFHTEMPIRRRVAAAAQTHDAYASEFARFKLKQDQDEANAAEPHAVALLVERLCSHPRPKMRYSVGMLGQRIVVPLKRFLPQRAYEWVLCRVIGL